MKRQNIIASLISLACLFCLAGPSWALPTPPSLKPGQPLTSELIAPRDASLLSEGLDAADENQWSRVRQIRRQITDRDAKNLLLWRIVTSGSSGASFQELDETLSTLAEWPRLSTVRNNAEEALTRSNLSDRKRWTWLADNPPQTGVGKLELARLLRSRNRAEESNNVVRDVWRNHSLSLSNSADTLRRYSDVLTPADHARRVEMLLWSGQRGEARRLLPELTSGERKAFEATLALMERRRGVDALVNAVPSSHADKPILLYQRARWRRRKNNIDGALELLSKLDATEAVPSGRDNIWRERHLMARKMIKARDWPTAYSLSINHGLERGGAFAQARFLAGWIALRQLDMPQEALDNFTTLSENVGTPISLGRGHFWRGEALSALGRIDEANAAYTEATRHIFTFYGQLAAERLQASGQNDAYLALDKVPAITPEERTAFLKRPVLRAARLLAETGRQRRFESFLYHEDDKLETPQEHQLLFEMAENYLSRRPGVRAGKTGLARGIVAPDAAYPIIPFPDSPLNGIAEDALVIALSRQESELEPTAISHANARGLMQLIPATGRRTAREIGDRFRTSWLVDDPEYNMRLGRAHMDSLVSRYNGSYILALAAYNAGASRPDQWIEDYGDPRSAHIDPVDWIESIPFSETRNYVMRIMENLQVYRHRLSDQPVQITLSEDIRRGKPD